jgi:hypothetical protein
MSTMVGFSSRLLRGAGVVAAGTIILACGCVRFPYDLYNLPVQPLTSTCLPGVFGSRLMPVPQGCMPAGDALQFPGVVTVWEYPPEGRFREHFAAILNEYVRLSKVVQYVEEEPFDETKVNYVLRWELVEFKHDSNGAYDLVPGFLLWFVLPNHYITSTVSLKATVCEPGSGRELARFSGHGRCNRFSHAAREKLSDGELPETINLAIQQAAMDVLCQMAASRDLRGLP